MPAFLRCHSAIAGGGRGTREVGPAPERLLGLTRERAETHPRDGDRDFQLDRLRSVAIAERHCRIAGLAITLQRVAGNRGAEEQQVVEMRHFPFRAATANIVDSRRRRAPDLRHRVRIERVREAGQGAGSVFRGVHDRPFEIRRPGLDPGSS